MSSQSKGFGLSVAVVLVGLVFLLGAEAIGASVAVVTAGGVVVLVGIGILTTSIATLPPPDEGHPEH